MDFIEISSGKPLRARYDLGIADLNSALADYLSSATDARMGYVGSWHSHPAAVGLHDGAADVQPHAHAARLGGEEGLEQAVLDLRAQALSLIHI